MTTTAAPTRRGLERWAALGGVLYVVLFVIGTILLVGDEPNGDASPGEVVRWYSDSGHRDKITLGWALVGLGLFFFLWFLVALRALGGFAVNMAKKTRSDDTPPPQAPPPLIHAANDAGYVLHSTGGVGVG